MPNNMTPVQQARWDSIKAKVALKNARLIEAEASTAEAEQTLVQIIQDAQKGLVSVPKPGEEWDASKNYIEGNTVTRDGVTYTAQRYSRGIEPGTSDAHWAVHTEAEKMQAWNDITDGTVILEGTKVTYNGATWVCTSQHIKSTVYKPSGTSSKWAQVT